MSTTPVPDSLAPFSVELFGKTYKLNPREDLAIDEGNLAELMANQPAMFAYYGVIADMAQNVVEGWQVELQKKESELYDRIVAEGEVKQTEDPMKKAVRGHPEYHEIQDNLVNASMMAAKMRTLTNAFADRRFLLIAISGKTGWQMGQDASLMRDTKRTAPKPVAVAEHRTAGAFPGKKGTK